MAIKLARRRLAIYLAAVLVAAVGVFAPTPYSLLAPGRALDLRDVISVAGHDAPATHYYMTDVDYIPHASPFGLLAGFEPGWQIVRTADLQPTNVDDALYERVMAGAMSDSQSIAALVAERAAGLGVKLIPSGLRILSVLPTSHVGTLLRAGDDLVGVNGRKVQSVSVLQSLLGALTPGDRVTVTFTRLNQPLRAVIETIAIGGKARMGVSLEQFSTFPPPPIPVRFNVGRISGSSGGVMFALEIYRSFRPARHPPSLRIAGTGTLDPGGAVGPIAGTMQKLIAAQRAGATLFLVPAENYPEIRSVRGIKIVPIRTFRDAIQASGGV